MSMIPQTLFRGKTLTPNYTLELKVKVIEQAIGRGDCVQTDYSYQYFKKQNSYYQLDLQLLEFVLQFVYSS